MAEVWKPVVGYEGYYEVSDLGRVRSVDRITTHGHRRRGKLLRLVPYVDGRLRVNLSIGGRAKLHFVSRLVLDAFVGPQPNRHARHFPDRDVTNNRLCNLRWGTHSENMQDKTVHGTHPDRKGEKHFNSKLTVEAIEQARRDHAEGVPQSLIALRLGVHQSAISRALSGKRWSHIQSVPVDTSKGMKVKSPP